MSVQSQMVLRNNQAQKLTKSQADNNISVLAQNVDAALLGQSVLSQSVAAVLTGQSSAVVGYATLAELQANLSPVDKSVAYVTNDAVVTNNGTWRKSGATGVGLWIQSSFDRVAAAEENTEYTKFMQTAPKIQTTVTTDGEILNGAQWFDGVTTVGALPTSGGWKIPVGQTGNATYNRYHWPFTTAQSAAFVGRTVRFLVAFKTSADLLATIPAPGLGTGGTGATGVFSNKRLAALSSTRALLTFDYTFVGGETEINVYAQCTNGMARGIDLTLFASGQFYAVMDEKGTGEVITALASSLIENRVSPLETDLEYTKFVRTVPKVEMPVLSWGELFAGAQWFDGTGTAGATYLSGGWKVPVGQTGNASYIRFYWPFTLAQSAALSGRTVRFLVTIKTSPDLITTMQPQGLNTAVVGTAGTFSNKRLAAIDSTNAMFTFDYVFTGNETEVNAYSQFINGIPRPADMTFFATGQYYAALDGKGVGDSVRSIVAAANLSSYNKTITVKPDGTGNYTTLAAAIAAVGGGESITRRVLYRVYEGVYTDVNVTIPIFTDVVGIGQRNKVWFKGELPDSVAIATIPNTSTFWMNETSRIANVKVTAKNMRYPLHSDSGNSAKRALIEVEDCYVEHLGNAGARAYQTSIAQDPNLVWASETAWGCGTHSGQRIYSRRTTWISPFAAFYFHTSRDFTEPCLVTFEDSAAICTTNTGHAIVVQALGSGQNNSFIIRGSVIQGAMQVLPWPWLALDIYNQRGDRNSEVETYISGSSPVAWYSSNQTNVIELRSIDSSTSSVSVSGTGSVALFGSQPDYVAGGVGFPGRVYSQHAIDDPSGGGAIGLTLAERLGNCSTVNKTLTILFDGAVNKTITLSANYTGMTNAAIVAALNTALADGTRGFYVSNPYDNAVHITQSDREGTIVNTGTTTILKGMAVAYAGGRYLGRVATSADALSVLAGIATENIIPGKRGRFAKAGALVFRDQVLWSVAPSIAFGDVFGVSSTPGYLIENAAVTLLRCVDMHTTGWIFEIIK